MSRPLDVDLERWEPWTPAEAAALLRDVEARWYVLGGWALDLFLGHRTREHDDLEIGVHDGDFPQVQAALARFELVVVGDGRAWPLTEESATAHRQTWVREPGGPWRLDVVRERWEDDDWIYRRDERIRLPAERVLGETSDGIPYLRPELVLLFKAKATRPKDLADFELVLPALGEDARAWLRDALARTHPGHPWVDAVTSG